MNKITVPGLYTVALIVHKSTVINCLILTKETKVLTHSFKNQVGTFL